MAHFLRSEIASKQRINIVLVGCGGNGAAMLTGLARLDHALRQTSDQSLMVHTFDDDIVSESNVGRQPFYLTDVGRSKAIVLTERINHAYGIGWQAVHSRVGSAGIRGAFDMLITCVDTAKARRVIGNAIKNKKINPMGYWLDLGNRATDGQIVLGTTRQGPRKWIRLGDELHPARLPTVVERFPELLDPTLQEDDTPSCSLAEALEKQSLFVNQAMSSHALAMMWELLGRGRINYGGLFLNLLSGQAAPMPLPEAKLDALPRRKATPAAKPKAEQLPHIARRRRAAAPAPAETAALAA